MLPMSPHFKTLHFAAAKGLAAFIAFFSLLNVLGDRLTPGFDANLWWIDLRILPRPLANLLLLAFAAALIAWVLKPASKPIRISALSTISLISLAVLFNILLFFRLLAHHHISSSFPIPFSLLVLLGLVFIACSIPHPPQLSPRYHLTSIATFAACFIAFPLAQMLCFGHTDYRQQADVAVVFGARAYANGTPSQALADRVRTGCDLYNQGLVHKLIFSGGPGDGAFTEPDTMRRFALTLGVKDQDILLDPAGLNTASTVANTLPLFHQLHATKILAVSHAYHLPRVKMAYQRAGQEVYTVPARQIQTLSAMPFLMAREIAALWLYYLSPLIGHSMQERA
jgi:vancomycin permeability regulator SanA